MFVDVKIKLMNLKDISDIKPIDKNVIVIIISMFCVSFLQLHLFNIINDSFSIMYSVLISIGMSVCWILLNTPSVIMCYYSMTGGNKQEDGRYNTIPIVFVMGLLMLSWVVLLTYIAFEFKMPFKYFIRISIAAQIFRIVFWLMVSNVVDRRNKKSKEQ